MDGRRVNLSVIIPSRSKLNLLVSCNAVRTLEPEACIIVVDDGLEEGWQRPDLSPVVTIAGVKPFIFARNINLGIQVAGDDDVVLLNDDAVLESPGGFSAMQKCCEEQGDWGLISSTTNVAGNMEQHRRGDGAPGSGARSTARAVAFVCVFIPRRTIDYVGPLNERFTGYIDGEMVYGGEDDDYCYRVRRAGKKIGIFDGCYVNHSSLQSTFRPGNGGLPIVATRKRFREIHGFEMGTR